MKPVKICVRGPILFVPHENMENISKNCLSTVEDYFFAGTSVTLPPTSCSPLARADAIDW